MSKVYIVTEGNYSDYRIIAVFSSEALAAEYIAKAKGTLEEDRTWIEPHALDEPNEWGHVTTVDMDREGKTRNIRTRWKHLPTSKHRLIDPRQPWEKTLLECKVALHLTGAQ